VRISVNEVKIEQDPRPEVSSEDSTGSRQTAACACVCVCVCISVCVCVNVCV
jgi:hypothetical protein